MKKMFNIKKISIALITFLCMFLATNNVKAADIEYICRYKIDTSNYDKYYDNIRFQLKFKNNSSGIPFFGSYDINKKVYYENSNNLNLGQGYSASYYGDINGVTNEPVIFYQRLTVSNPSFKNYDYKTKGCPANIYYSVDQNNVDYAHIYEFSLDVDFLTKCNANQYAICGAISLDTINSSDKNNSNEEIGNTTGEAGNYKSCSYADLAIYKAQEGNVKKMFTLYFNSNNAYVDDYHEDVTWKIIPDFEANELKGECPSVVYLPYQIEGGDTVTMSLKKETHSSYVRYGLIVELNGSTDQDRENDICNGKTMKFVKIAYTLIRFLLPILVIIFSVIDFVGVVLSGETEKMEKAKKRFAIRLIVAVIILFIPAIIELLLKLAGIIDSGAGLVEFTCNLFN